MYPNISDASINASPIELIPLVQLAGFRYLKLDLLLCIRGEIGQKDLPHEPIDADFITAAAQTPPSHPLIPDRAHLQLVLQALHRPAHLMRER